ncbi:MAG: hypothetical protein QM535_17745 [Limnohabitans sp.]|nr:hypothetical protein [Limnohabitans sp.]
MKKIIFLLICLNLSAQNVSKEQFVNTEWFSDNSNQKFYKSDTIYLRQLLHYECDYKNLSRAHIISYFNKNQDTEVLNFHKKDKIEISDITMNWCSHLRTLENWKWSFDQQSQTLYFISDKNSKLSYRILDRFNEKFSWKREVEEGKITNFKTDFITLKLLRIK